MRRYKSYFKEAKMSLLYDKFKNTEFYKKGFSIGNIVSQIIENIKKYERDPNYKYILNLKAYIGLKNILFSNKKYTLYRGLLLNKDSFDIDYYREQGVFESKNPQISWTTSIRQAESFAKGFTSHMSQSKLSDYNFGIVLKYIPSANEILYDFQYMEDEYDIYSSFSENEVICIPKTKKFKIIKIVEYEI
jgi:hypothetical protein